MLLASNLGGFNWVDITGAECPRVKGYLIVEDYLRDTAQNLVSPCLFS